MARDGSWRALPPKPMWQDRAQYQRGDERGPPGTASFTCPSAVAPKRHRARLDPGVRPTGLRRCQHPGHRRRGGRRADGGVLPLRRQGGPLRCGVAPHHGDGHRGGACSRADDEPGDAESLGHVIEAVWDWLDAHPDENQLLHHHLPGVTSQARVLQQEFEAIHVQRAFAYLATDGGRRSRRSATADHATASLAVRTLNSLVILVHPLRSEEGPIARHRPRDVRAGTRRGGRADRLGLVVARRRRGVGTNEPNESRILAPVATIGDFVGTHGPAGAHPASESAVGGVISSSARLRADGGAGAGRCRTPPSS